MRISPAVSHELLSPPSEVVEGRTICFSEQVTCALGKKKKNNPQQCISNKLIWKDLFKALKIEKKIEEESHKVNKRRGQEALK